MGKQTQGGVVSVYFVLIAINLKSQLQVRLRRFASRSVQRFLGINTGYACRVRTNRRHNPRSGIDEPRRDDEYCSNPRKAYSILRRPSRTFSMSAYRFSVDVQVLISAAIATVDSSDNATMRSPSAAEY
jgi:hypothetical protein